MKKKPWKKKDRALKAIQWKESKVWDRIEENVDMAALHSFLEANPQNDRYDQLLILMQDPAYIGETFRRLCRRANVSFSELQELYTNGMRHLALLKVSNAMPDLMVDILVDAQSTMETCPRCDGYGKVASLNSEEKARTCPTCKGKKEVRRMGDTESRKLVLEASRMIKESKPMVTLQQNFVSTDSLESILKKTREIALETPNGRQISGNGDNGGGSQ